MRLLNRLSSSVVLLVKLLRVQHYLKYPSPSFLSLQCASWSPLPVDWGKLKKNRKNLNLKVSSQIMADPKIEEILAPLRASVRQQVIDLCSSPLVAISVILNVLWSDTG